MQSFFKKFLDVIEAVAEIVMKFKETIIKCEIVISQGKNRGIRLFEIADTFLNVKGWKEC